MFGLFLFWILWFKDVQPGLFFIRIFRVLNTVQSFIFKVHAVVCSQQQLFKYITVAFVCQQLFLFFFWTFWSSLPPFSAASYIISNLPTNVNNFFQLFLNVFWAFKAYRIHRYCFFVCCVNWLFWLKHCPLAVPMPWKSPFTIFIENQTEVPRFYTGLP